MQTVRFRICYGTRWSFDHAIRDERHTLCGLDYRKNRRFALGTLRHKPTCRRCIHVARLLRWLPHPAPPARHASS